MATTFGAAPYGTTRVVDHVTTRKLGTELIGTFFLVFTVGASVRGGSTLAPLAI
ncbi:MAG: hypothetical protein QOD82_3787, partial [Pseudonocardiales bacterium]|nr:hypothetical protein [Pseudonocardiales bacterium]